MLKPKTTRKTTPIRSNGKKFVPCAACSTPGVDLGGWVVVWLGAPGVLVVGVSGVLVVGVSLGVVVLGLVEVLFEVLFEDSDGVVVV